MGNPLLLDMVLYLKAKGLVVDDGIDAFRDFTPESPDSAVMLHEYKGTAAFQHEPAVHRSVQVSCRSKQADDARRKALDIYNSFVSENLIVQLTETRWGQVFLRQPPFKIERDSLDRTTYGFNLGITTTNE